MNTKTLSSRAASVIDEYMHIKVGDAVTSVPYFNNKTTNKRAGLRTYIGKGSPKDIFDEMESIIVKEHLSNSSLADESLKKILVDNNIGIDCSGFAYYVLGAESIENKKGQLDKHLKFIRCKGLIGKIKCSLRPVENCDVATFRDDRNSRVINLENIAPGDFIAMTNSDDPSDNERDHIIVIYQVEYQNFKPFRIHYVHAAAYPEDGLYGTGVRQGEIEIFDTNSPIVTGRWTEGGKTKENNRLFVRASRSNTEIRRLRWW